jgi:hypothetical protein
MYGQNIRWVEDTTNVIDIKQNEYIYNCNISYINIYGYYVTNQKYQYEFVINQHGNNIGFCTKTFNYFIEKRHKIKKEINNVIIRGLSSYENTNMFDSYVVEIDGLLYFVHKDSVKNNELLDEFNEKAKIFENELNFNNTIKIIKSYCTKPDYAGGINYNADIQNLSNKTIKYIIISGICHNAVDDPVKCNITGAYFHTFRITGPIVPKQHKHVQWSEIYTNVNVYLKILDIEIEYMNGEKIKLSNKIIFDSIRNEY